MKSITVKDVGKYCVLKPIQPSINNAIRNGMVMVELNIRSRNCSYSLRLEMLCGRKLEFMLS